MTHRTSRGHGSADYDLIWVGLGLMGGRRGREWGWWWWQVHPNYLATCAYHTSSTDLPRPVPTHQGRPRPGGDRGTASLHPLPPPSWPSTHPHPAHQLEVRNPLIHHHNHPPNKPHHPPQVLQGGPGPWHIENNRRSDRRWSQSRYWSAEARGVWPWQWRACRVVVGRWWWNEIIWVLAEPKLG